MLRRLSSERGFTLLELLVASSLTLVVLAGTMTTFEESRRVIDASTRVTDTSQNLRASANLMVRDLLQAGRNIPTSGIPLPIGDGVSAINRPAPAGVREGGSRLAAGTASVAGVIPGAGLGPTVSAVVTDVVAVIYNDPSLALNQWPLVSIAADGSSAVVDPRTPISDAATGVVPGDVMLFNNAVGYAAQQVTRVVGQTLYFDASGDVFGFNQRGASSGSVMQIRAGAAFPPTSVTRVVMVTYYIDAVTVPAQPRLVRRINFQPAQIIAADIDNLQVTYDVVDGVTNPVNLKSPLSPNTPQQIRGINLYLTARGASRAQSAGSGVHRGLATQVSLRSMSFIDRYR
jgi:prepilin-type N-terminal cleavage/methylation domain-containing protein